MQFSIRNLLAIMLIVVAAMALKHRDYYFGPAIFETGDYAANALQITQAKHGKELYGNYSRWGFHHPGPGFFYVYALSEAVLYDLIPVFHSPHQAHAFAGLALQSVFFSFGLLTLCSFARSPAFLAIIATIASIHFTASGVAFTSIWAPNTIVMPFLAFIVGCSALAAGFVRFLPWTVAAACFLVHGHVAQPLFVVPLFFSAVGFAWKTAPSDWQIRSNRRTFAISGSILFVAILPILIDIFWVAESNFNLASGHHHNRSD